MFNSYQCKFIKHILILLVIALFALFFAFISDVGAESLYIDAAPTRIGFNSSFNNTNVGNSYSFTTSTLAGTQFYRTSNEEDYTQLRIYYNSGQFSNFNVDAVYSAFFTVHSKKKIQAISVDSASKFFNGIVLNSSFDSDSTFYVYSVYVPSFQIGSSKNFYINVFFQNEDTTGYYNASFGISKSLTFVTNDDVEKIATEINKGVTDINNKVDEINDYITDDTAPEADLSSLNSLSGIFPPGPVDSLLNIPVKFLQVIINGLGGTCSTLNIPFVYDTTIQYQCFNSVYDEVPKLLMNFINLIPSAFILIKYFKHLYKKVDRATNMNSNADDEWGVI